MFSFHYSSLLVGIGPPPIHAATSPEPDLDDQSHERLMLPNGRCDFVGYAATECALAILRLTSRRSAARQSFMARQWFEPDLH
jgi:hypothetical protein